MKKLLFFTFCFIVIGKTNIKANDLELFNYDKVALEDALSDLSVLESFISDHPFVSLID